MGAEKPLKQERSSEGIASCSNLRIGGSASWPSGVCIVMECSVKKAAASEDVAGGARAAEAEETDAATASFLSFFFLSLCFSVLGIEDDGSASASCSCFRFLLFLSLSVAMSAL